MTKTFSKRDALMESYQVARKLALPLLPYYLVAAGLIVALYVLSTLINAAEAVTFVIDILGIVLMCSIAVMFYLRALQRQDPLANLIRDTTNLFLATLLVALLFSIMGFLHGLFLVVFAGILLVADGFDPEAFEGNNAEITSQITQFLQQPEGFIIGVLLLITLFVLGWLAARLVTFGIATAAFGRIRVFQTWGWTRGHALSLMLTGAVVSLLPFIVMLTASLVVSFQLEDTNLPRWLVQLVDQCVMYTLFYPAFLLGHGFAVAVYRQLCTELLDVEDAFG